MRVLIERIAVLLIASAVIGLGTASAQVKTESGAVEGTTSPDARVRIYRGIPFAAPPVGELRWKAPRPVAPWQGVRKATAFGNRCMQGPIFADMIFRDEVSEDCLYLNVWTPARQRPSLPVMVWIYGGGFQAGSAPSRARTARARGQGVVVVSLNYRLGVFGFFAHPELTRSRAQPRVRQLRAAGPSRRAAVGEGEHRGVRRRSGNVTIFGESAGSFAVSALMASPLATGPVPPRHRRERRVLQRAAARSRRRRWRPRRQGREFAAVARRRLARRPAGEAGGGRAPGCGEGPPGRWFSPIIDGYVLPRDVHSIYADGQAEHVPLLAGWNADEVRAGVVLAKEKPTAAASPSRRGAVRHGRRCDAEGVSGRIDAEAARVGGLACERPVHRLRHVEVDRGAPATGDSPVYRYSFDRKARSRPTRR